MSNKHDNHEVIKEISFTLLGEGKSVKIRADGYSMYPAIKPGSIIFIEPICQGPTPVPGEIVAWKRRSGFVVHRLLRIIKKNNQTFFITRGDSCAAEDQPVSAGFIAGKVVRIENQKGKIIKENKNLSSKPNYNLNRLRVSGIHILKKFYLPGNHQ